MIAAIPKYIGCKKIAGGRFPNSKSLMIHTPVAVVKAKNTIVNSVMRSGILFARAYFY